MRRTLTMVLLVSAGWAGVADAADKPVYAPAPAWVMAAPPIDATKLTDASPVIVRFDNQQRLEDGRVWAFVDVATRAASSQQLSEIGDIKLQWQPTQGDLIIHAAEILRGTQRIDLIKGGTPFTVLRRETELDQRMLDGVLTATMPAEGLAVGDVLHLSYSVTRRDPTLKGDLQTFAPLMAEPLQIGFGRVRLSWPASADVKWKSFADGASPKLGTTGGFHELEVALPLAKQPEIPGDAPARYAKLPILEATSFSDWAAVSKAMAPLYATDGLIVPGSPLAAEVARIKASEADPLKRAAAALQLVQDKVRYLLLGMDTGNYVPQTPAQTWERRYGDCKAKTLLLLAMLHAMSIEAEPVAANLQLGELVPERLPGLGAFNHILVRATIAGQTYWLDGTGSGTRLADIGDTPRLGSVLPIRTAGATLLPVVLHADARPTLVVSVDVDDRAGVDTPSIVTASITFRGGAAEAIGAGAAQASPQQRTDMVQRLMSEQVGRGNYIDPKVTYDRDAGTATVSAVGVGSTRWTWSERRYRLPLDSVTSKLDFDPDRTRVAWNGIPVRLSGPATAIYRTTVHLPDGGTGYILEGDQALPPTLAGSALKRSVRQAGDTIVVEDRVDEIGGEIAAADIPATRAAVTQARNRALTVVAPQNAGGAAAYSAARGAGRYKPVEAIFARVIASDPKNADVIEWRGRMRRGATDWTGAVADFTSAIGVEPTVARYLSRAALYGTTGQDARQLADLLAAVKLDPASDDAVVALADYKANHGQATEAVSLIEQRLALAGSKDRSAWLARKASVQADAGDAEAALATIGTALRERPGNPMLLNQSCWIRGTRNVAPETGLKECTKAIELADNSTAALDSRAMIYFRMGRFDDSLADLGAALESSPDMAASRFMRGIVLQRMGKVAEGSAEIARARLTWPGVLRQYAR